MKRRTLVLIIGIALLVLIAGTLFLINSNNNTARNKNNNPFGNPSGDTTFNQQDQNGNKLPPIKTNGIQTLKEISTTPVAGAIVLSTPSVSIVRYNTKDNSHIYDFNLATSLNLKVSNTTIPKIYEAMWGSYGNAVLLRYTENNNDAIKTFAGNLIDTPQNINASSSDILPKELKGQFLDDNILSITLSPLKNKIFYIKEQNNRAAGIISNIDGSRKIKIFDSPVLGWIVSWPKESTITLTTKASGLFSGYLYFLNTKTGSIQKIISNVAGLTTNTNAQTSIVLYSDGIPTLHALNLIQHTDNPLPLNTLAEKCAWSTVSSSIVYCAIPKGTIFGTYPEDWYQGSVSFSDTIAKIDVNTGSFTYISVDEFNVQNLDIINPIVSTGDHYLVFTNKKDYSLWSLMLSTSTNSH